jgi:hypothetical protein
MNNGGKTTIALITMLGVLTVTVLFYLTFQIMQKQLKIQTEQHILNLYMTYKSNIDSCTGLARQSGQDENFIKENCIKTINSSLVGKNLIEWGRSDLLVSEY